MAGNAASAAVRVPEVILIGLDGFGRQHLDNIARLTELGKVRLTGGVSFTDPGPEVRGEIPVYQTLREAHADGHRPDIIIVSTPISTHFDLAAEALRMGADVLLEKPPTATLDQYQHLMAEADQRGRSVQVGFQSMGSHALPAIEELLAPKNGTPGAIGELRAVGATGLWLRTEAYFARAPWAGRRALNGIEVVDGVVTNPLAHAVKTALHVAGAKRPGDVAQLHTELHHAHEIEADDTSIVQLRTTGGIPVTAALTLCAAEQQDPWITIFGTEGEATLHYTRDELVVAPNPQKPGAGEPETLTFGRTNLLENLIDFQTGVTDRLLSPLRDHGAFMKVLEAVRTADTPKTITDEHLEYAGEDSQRHPIVPHIEDYLARAVKASPSSFSALGAPWAAEPPLSGQLQAGFGDALRRVADLRTGEDVSATDSPRPFLDEVTTMGGIVVTDQQPLDHTWHLGVGTALQDVNGNNFWGGRTYTREAGRYIWRKDHGRLSLNEQQILQTESGQQLRQQLRWIGADAEPVVTERRTVGVSALAEDRWELDYAFELTPAADEAVSLGSPGSNGRVSGGYGGFFWRLPQIKGASIFTAEAEGEDAVHGSLSRWLAIAGEFQPLPSRRGHGGTASLLLIRDAGNPDPWFVRYKSYPGLGMSLAWEAPVVLRPGETVARSVRVLVVDGLLTAEQATELAGEQQ